MCHFQRCGVNKERKKLFSRTSGPFPAKTHATNSEKSSWLQPLRKPCFQCGLNKVAGSCTSADAHRLTKPMNLKKVLISLMSAFWPVEGLILISQRRPQRRVNLDSTYRPIGAQA
jgi:hypothetical protein